MKLKAILFVFVLLVLNVLTVKAQSDPCGADGAPDGTECPLDTWVFVLAIGALIITSFHLYRRQQKPRSV